jgi:hypothetical protein
MLATSRLPFLVDLADAGRVRLGRARILRLQRLRRGNRTQETPAQGVSQRIQV